MTRKWIWIIDCFRAHPAIIGKEITPFIGTTFLKKPTQESQAFLTDLKTNLFLWKHCKIKYLLNFHCQSKCGIYYNGQYLKSLQLRYHGGIALLGYQHWRRWFHLRSSITSGSLFHFNHNLGSACLPSRDCIDYSHHRSVLRGPPSVVV